MPLISVFSPKKPVRCARTLENSSKGTTKNAPMIGPFDTWPTFSGFEYYYGFIGAEDNQWHPTLT